MVLASVALAVLLALPGASRPDAASPALVLAEGVPRDVGDLAWATWIRFVDAFPARRSCLDPVTVAAAPKLDDRATYDPDRRLVTVRIPATAPALEASFVHEFAHHLEFTCADHETLRPSFLGAQGHSQDDSWFGGATWEETPSEQFAEATSSLVLGRRHSHFPIAIADRAVAVIRAWAHDERLKHRP